MEKNKTDLLDDVAIYYSDKLSQFGETPQGVDWNGKESQYTRFEKLCMVINSSEGFSVTDLGCGYGALFDYLSRSHKSFSYLGYDVSKDMVKVATDKFKGSDSACFSVSSKPETVTDYGIASGIFSVRLSRTDDEWAQYIQDTLDILDSVSRSGFAFNCLTSYSDSDKMRDDLYYADPCELFDLCKRRFSRDVALLHDYELYEFTVIVRK